MRRLQLLRNVDIHGISGTGIVAEGVEFDDGSVVMKWLTETSTKVHYNSLEDLRKIHVEGHGDEENNQIVFLDEQSTVEKSDKPALSEKALYQEMIKASGVYISEMGWEARDLRKSLLLQPGDPNLIKF